MQYVLLLSLCFGGGDQWEAELAKLRAIDQSILVSQENFFRLAKAEAIATRRPLFLSIGTDPPPGVLAVRMEEYLHFAPGQTLVLHGPDLKVVGMLPAHRTAAEVEKSLTAPAPVMAPVQFATMSMMRSSFGFGGGFGAFCGPSG